MFKKIFLFYLLFCFPIGSTEIIKNKTFKNIKGVAINLEKKQDIIIDSCIFENVGIAVRLKSCKNITIINCTIKDLTIQGIDIREGCTDIHILNNKFFGFRKDVQGGHFISTQKTKKPIQKRIFIIGNTLIANFKSWVKGRKNGASGDMIAIRSVSGFYVINNFLIGGGEFGMDCLYNSENGIVAHNTIKNIDGTGLLVGYGAKNINIYANNIIDTGMSYETDHSKNDITHQSGIHLRGGVENVIITSNIILRIKAEEMRYGIHLREAKGILIKSNIIKGVDEKIHIPKAFIHTVSILNNDIKNKK